MDRGPVFVDGLRAEIEPIAAARNRSDAAKTIGFVKFYLFIESVIFLLFELLRERILSFFSHRIRSTTMYEYTLAPKEGRG